MNTNKRDDFIRLQAQVLNARHNDPKKGLSICKELLQLSQEYKDTYNEAFAYLYLCDFYDSLGFLDLSLDCGHKGLKLQLQHNYVELMAMQYNVFGTIAVTQGDEKSALEYYVRALEITKTLNKPSLLCAIYCNLGDLYDTLHMYQKSFDYYNLGLSEILSSSQNVENVYISLSYVYIALANTLIHLNKLEEASYYLDSVSASGVELDYSENCSYLFVQAFYSYSQKNIDEAIDKLNHFLHIVSNVANKFNMIEYLLKACSLSLQLEQLDMTKEFLYRIHTALDDTTILNYFVQYHQLRITYYTAIQDSVSLVQAYEDYFHADMDLNKLIKNQLHISTLNRLELEKTRRSNLELLKSNHSLKNMAETDALTQVGNRYGLNRYMKTNYKKCKQKKQTFGSIIIDIDFFKEYNDTYGHLNGDSCLQQIAIILKSCCPKNCYVGRYGGDEFMIHTINLTTEEISDLAGTIIEKVTRLNIPHIGSKVSSHVTLSMGISNLIPSEEINISYCIHLADIALYKIKESGRNNYLLESTPE